MSNNKISSFIIIEEFFNDTSEIFSFLMLAAHVLDGVAYLMNNEEQHGCIRKDATYGAENG